MIKVALILRAINPCFYFQTVTGNLPRMLYIPIERKNYSNSSSSNNGAKMTELKTKPNDGSVEDFLNKVTDEKRRNDCYTILEFMKQVTGQEPKMWGDSIFGFGSYHYKYKMTNL